MRTLPVLLAAGLLTGCGGGRNLQPVNVSGPVSGATPRTMECLAREMDDMGYDVTSRNEATGTITGLRVNEQPWWLRIIGFNNTADQITATVTGGQLQVTALSSDPEDPAGGGVAGGASAGRSGGASQVAQENAQRLLELCGGT